MQDRGSGNRRPLVIAFYLPQFHAVPENDAWWGRGFTEWTNVTRARPYFEGHYQPRHPGELGYYDLRLPEVRAHQASLAQGYGIDGFCYYHYWFHGRRILERPFEEVLATKKPDFPFCLAWANENWTRQWDAGNNSILIEQRYSREDDEQHIQYLLRAFSDPRYIRVAGRPLLLVYRVQAMPEPVRTFTTWRERCEEAGIPAPLIVKFDTHGDFDDPACFGCDAAAEFLPHGVAENIPLVVPPGANPGNIVARYEDLATFFSERSRDAWTRFPCVLPGWDNSPRRPDGKAMMVIDNSPELFEWWLGRALERASTENRAQPIVFLNAWNEWAEGAYLEPDARYGRAYLEAVARAVAPYRSMKLAGNHRPSGRRDVGEPATFSGLYLDLYEKYVMLQREHSEFLHSFERRIDATRRGAETRIRELETNAARLAEWAASLKGQLDKRERAHHPLPARQDTENTG